MSAIIGTDQYKCYFNQSNSKSCTGPTANVQGGITASMAGGSWLGAIASGYISDVLGRKKAIMVGAVIWFALPSSPLRLDALCLTPHFQVHWQRHRLCFAEYRHVNCWPCHQRPLRRHLLRPSPGVHIRTRASLKTWSTRRRSAMGHYLGHYDHVLHFGRPSLSLTPGSF